MESGSGSNSREDTSYNRYDVVETSVFYREPAQRDLDDSSSSSSSSSSGGSASDDADEEEDSGPSCSICTQTYIVPPIPLFDYYAKLMTQSEPELHGPIITHCGHVFHGDCLMQWSVRKGDCPYCRATLFPPSDPLSAIMRQRYGPRPPPAPAPHNAGANSARYECCTCTWMTRFGTLISDIYQRYR
jgi:hypothetical protein